MSNYNPIRRRVRKARRDARGYPRHNDGVTPVFGAEYKALMARRLRQVQPRDMIRP